MKRIGFFIVAGGLALGGCSEQKVNAAEKVARKEVQLTIYKDDFAMVREVRPVGLRAGRNEIALEQVSSALDPRSVLFDWRGENLPALVANTYDVGVSNGNALVKRYLGKPVELIRYGNTGRQSDSQKGTLMVAQDGNFVLQTDDSFYINPQGTIVAPAQSDIVTIPRLSVVAESPRESNADLEVAYLTRGLSWTADYVGIVDPKSNVLRLQCWATVENGAGVDFPDAKITLVAGSPNRAADYPDIALAGTNRSGRMAEGGEDYMMNKPSKAAWGTLPSMSLGELQSYEVKNKSDISQAQLNRLLMLESKEVSAKKDYSVRLPEMAAWDYYWWPEDRPAHQKVTAAFTFFNKEKDGLGTPLPAGAIRLYEGDGGSVQYIGGAEIQDTPVGEKINFTLSNVFDVTATNKIISKTKKGKTMTKTAEVTLRNSKASPIEIRAVQGVAGNWKLVSESSKSTKLDARTLQWMVTVPAKGEAKVRYTVAFGK